MVGLKTKISTKINKKTSTYNRRNFQYNEFCYDIIDNKEYYYSSDYIYYEFMDMIRNFDACTFANLLTSQINF